MILIERLVMVCNFFTKPEGTDNLYISLNLLNYLVMVPLDHNVRSLKYLIDHCLEPVSLDPIKPRKSLDEKDYLPGKELRLKKEMRILYDMHLTKEPFFESPTELWRVLGVASGNSAAGCVFSEDGDLLIRIPSKKEAGKEREKREEKRRGKENG